jgi:hypothetical protein
MVFIGWISRASVSQTPVEPNKSIKEIKKEIEKAYIEEHVADALRPFVRNVLSSKKYKQ